MDAHPRPAVAGLSIRAGHVLLGCVMACAVPAGASTIILPGAGEIVTSGVFTIPAGETAELQGTLAGDARLYNYGTLVVSGGPVIGHARIDNFGNIQNLQLNEYAAFSNLGFINNLVMTGSASGANHFFVNNVSIFGTSFLQNNGTMNNVTPFAGNGDSVGFQNNGTANNVGANVLSPENNGFINIQNNGLIKNLVILDNAPFRAAPASDLITVNNSGTIQSAIASSAGIGAWAVNDWGSIWSFVGSGSGSMTFSGDQQMSSLYLSSVGQSLRADGSAPLMLSSDLRVGAISLQINGTLAVGQAAAPVPEPGTLAVFPAALALGFLLRSRRKAG